MRSVIVCEGRDDLWFIGYYLYKVLHWEECKPKLWCTAYLPNVTSGQRTLYMSSPDKYNRVLIFSSGGQDNIKALLDDWIDLNEKNPSSAIDSIVIFRDCDDRPPDELAHTMEAWFSNHKAWLPDHFALKNNEPLRIQKEIDEIDVVTTILPVLIPFDESGAIETLLLKSIEDSGKEGAYVAQSARSYIDSAKDNVFPRYLNKQRLFTKAKYSAAIAITNPDHSTGTFKDFMLSTPWDESASIKDHMKKVVRLITGQLDPTHTR